MEDDNPGLTCNTGEASSLRVSLLSLKNIRVVNICRLEGIRNNNKIILPRKFLNIRTV